MLCWLGNRFEEILLSELTSHRKYLHCGRLWLVGKVCSQVKLVTALLQRQAEGLAGGVVHESPTAPMDAAC